MKLFRIATLAAGCFLAVTSARADSWAQAETQVVESPGHRARATILPRDVASPLAYFSDASKDLPQPGQQSGGATQARAIVELKEKSGWRVLWRGPLVNDVSPVGVMVTDAGRLVTLDNWHSIGYGPHVIVIYDTTGKIVRGLALTDFLPKSYADTIPRSVSSRQWRRNPRLSADQSKLLVDVVAPGSEGFDETGPTVPFQFDLRDGGVLATDQAAFEKAKAEGLRLDAKQREEMRQWRLARQVPWPSPRGKDEDAWKEYAHELKRRKISAGSDFFVPAKESADHAEAAQMLAKWIGEIASYRGYERTEPALFGSVERGEAATIMLPALRAIPDKSWRGVTLLYVGESEFTAAIEAQVRRLGANYQFIDVEKPLPPASPDSFPEDDE